LISRRRKCVWLDFQPFFSLYRLPGVSGSVMNCIGTDGSMSRPGMGGCDADYFCGWLQKRRRAGGRRSDRDANGLWNGRRAGGWRSITSPRGCPTRTATAIVTGTWAAALATPGAHFRHAGPHFPFHHRGDSAADFCVGMSEEFVGTGVRGLYLALECGHISLNSRRAIGQITRAVWNRFVRRPYAFGR
jgi:hypothetical protein